MITANPNKLRISDQFVIAAKQSASKVGIEFEGQSFTYGELDADSLALSQALSDALPAQSVVGVYARRSASLVVAMLACARADMIFVVLDSAYPQKRIQQMLDIAQPTLILGTDIKGEQSGQVLKNLAGSIPVWHLHSGRKNIRWSTHRSIPEKTAAHPDAQRIAYLLFTSGTTGTPKCIKTGHEPLAHFVSWYGQEFSVTSADTFSMLSGLGHDPVMRDVFVPLSHGARLCIPPSDIIINPSKIFGWFGEQKINYAHATPQLLKILTSGGDNLPRLNHLKYVFSGGDALRSEHVRHIRKIAPGCDVVNFYGTTETPQAMLFYRVEPEPDVADAIPVGIPIEGVTLHLLNEDLSPTRNGESGQVAIETDYLSLGYVGGISIDANRFVHLQQLPHQPRVYLTGDYGVQRPDGALILKGRIDDQVKVRGYRVELGEINASLEALDGVQSAVVLASTQANGETMLTAYIAAGIYPADGLEIVDQDKQSIKSALATKLPGHMVPAHYFGLAALPLLPNGKLDRQALRSLKAREFEEDDDVLAALTPQAQELAQKWQVILGQGKIDASKSFVDLGGDSLSFIQASIAVESMLGWLPEDWENQPLRALAALETQSRHWAVQIEPAILLRCIGIFFVVLTHAGYYEYNGTSILFVVSGMSFAKFFQSDLLVTGRLKPIFKFIAKFGVPAGLWRLGSLLYKHDHFWLPDVFLLGTFFVDSQNPHFAFWYLDVLAANILIIAVATAFLGVIHRSLALSQKIFVIDMLLVALGLFAAYGQAATGWHDGTLGLTSVAPFKWLWMIALGVTITHADRPLKKAGLLLLTILIFWTKSWDVPSLTRAFDVIDWFFVASIAVLIFKDRVFIPNVLRTAIVSIASASLFIYIVNYVVITKTESVLKFAWSPVAAVVLALCTGIICSRIWNRAISALAQGWPTVAKKIWKS